MMVRRNDSRSRSSNVWFDFIVIGWSTAAERRQRLRFSGRTNSKNFSDAGGSIGWRSYASATECSGVSIRKDWKDSSFIPSLDNAVEEGLTATTTPAVGYNVWCFGTVRFRTIRKCWASDELSTSQQFSGITTTAITTQATQPFRTWCNTNTM